MKRLLITAIIVALACPAVVIASHHKRRRPTNSAPLVGQATVNGRVVHGTHAVRAKVMIHPRGHHGPQHHPAVSSGGLFSAHLNPGTYVVSASRRGAGRGRISFHVERGQNLNVVVALYHHHRGRYCYHPHQRHSLGVRHHTTSHMTSNPKTNAKQNNSGTSSSAPHPASVAPANNSANNAGRIAPVQ